MSPQKPWEPTIERADEFNPFASVDGDRGPFSQTPRLRNPEEDTAPLQGSKDISDSDSLQDVVADAYDEQPAAAEEIGETKASGI
jgi:hypothetical protein